jgi:hypothetical protein
MRERGISGTSEGDHAHGGLRPSSPGSGEAAGLLSSSTFDVGVGVQRLAKRAGGNADGSSLGGSPVLTGASGSGVLGGSGGMGMGSSGVTAASSSGGGGAAAAAGGNSDPAFTTPRGKSKARASALGPGGGILGGVVDGFASAFGFGGGVTGGGGGNQG